MSSYPEMCECCFNIFNFYIPKDVRNAAFCPNGRVLTTHNGKILVQIPWKAGEFEYILHLLDEIRHNRMDDKEAQELWLSKLFQFAREQGRWRAYYQERRNKASKKAGTGSNRSEAKLTTQSTAETSADGLPHSRKSSVPY